MDKRKNVIVYPAHLSAQGKQSLYDACIIADFEEPLLISSSKAIAASYAMEHATDLVNLQQSKIIVFVEMGYAASQITVVLYQRDDENSNAIKVSIIC